MPSSDKPVGATQYSERTYSIGQSRDCTRTPSLSATRVPLSASAERREPDYRTMLSSNAARSLGVVELQSNGV